MQRSLFKNLGAALALGLGLTAAPASAAGLLGERYVAVGYDHAIVESAAYEDGGGMTLVYNHPLSDKVDLGGSYTFLSYDGANGRDEVGDFTDQRLQFFMTAYGLPDGIPDFDRIWVRVGAGFGNVEHGDRDTTNLSWLGMIGTEYPMGERSVLQPYVGWSDVINDGESVTFVYGLQAVFDVAEKVGVSLRVQGDQRYNITLSLGGLFRF